MPGDLVLTGGFPKVYFVDTDDSTYFNIQSIGTELQFSYDSLALYVCGHVKVDASMSLVSPVIVEDVTASESRVVFAAPATDDTRIRATTSGQLQVSHYSGGWSDILMVTGGANPKIEVMGPITNDSGAGGQVIVFANDINSGDIARFYSGANLRASILNDGLVDLSTGGLCLIDCGTFPAPTVNLVRNIYFQDSASTPQIGVVTTTSTPGVATMKKCTLS
jgi:hypothetical protein